MKQLPFAAIVAAAFLNIEVKKITGHSGKRLCCKENIGYGTYYTCVLVNYPKKYCKSFVIASKIILYPVTVLLCRIRLNLEWGTVESARNDRRIDKSCWVMILTENWCWWRWSVTVVCEWVLSCRVWVCVWMWVTGGECVVWLWAAANTTHCTALHCVCCLTCSSAAPLVPHPPRHLMSLSIKLELCQLFTSVQSKCQLAVTTWDGDNVDVCGQTLNRDWVRVLSRVSASLSRLTRWLPVQQAVSESEWVSGNTDLCFTCDMMYYADINLK